MTSADNNNDWLALIHTAMAQGMSKQAIANVVGVHRSYISQAVHNLGNLGNGSASPRHLAQKVRNTLGAFACPFLTDESGQEVRITGLVCRGYAHKAAPTANPRELRHWRTCQGCPKKQTSALPSHKANVSAKPPAAPAACTIRNDADLLMVKVPQQAGVIDTVTLPLPEVGGPQIEKGHAQ